MVRNLYINKILWLLTAFLSLVAALAGVFSPGIYQTVVKADIIPGIFGQDLMTIVAAVVIIFLAICTKKEDTFKQILILGIIGYLFYAYGIYVIERIYNLLYYLYLAILGLSFWSLAYSIGKIDREIIRKVRMSGLMLKISAGFSLFVALVFSILWIVQLLPLLQAGEKIEFFYSVFILDLCFIMPAFAITGVMAFRKAGLGLMLIPAMFVLGFTLIFSLAVSELLKPLYGLAIDMVGLLPSLVLSIVFLILTALHFRSLKAGGEAA